MIIARTTHDDVTVTPLLHHFVYRKVSLIVVLFAFLTRVFWIPWIGRSLVCREDVAPSDAILVENFDPDYRAFERAAALQKAGFSGRILIPTEASEHDPEVADTISRGITELMSRVARLENIEIIPIREIEPISLNAAYQIRDFLTREHLGSLIVVTPGFRSRRSSLIYRAVLTPAGVQTHCMPVYGHSRSRRHLADIFVTPRRSPGARAEVCYRV
jgi:hypothetical protein